MTLRAAGVVPPMRLPPLERTPAPVLRAAVPAALVPMKLPSTMLFRAAVKNWMAVPVLLMTNPRTRQSGATIVSPARSSICRTASLPVVSVLGKAPGWV